jgi:hypothetical protein
MVLAKQGKKQEALDAFNRALKSPAKFPEAEEAKKMISSLSGRP